jgi:hypothetical protein
MREESSEKTREQQPSATQIAHQIMTGGKYIASTHLQCISILIFNKDFIPATHRHDMTASNGLY